LKGIQRGIQPELHYECLGQARHQRCVGLATFAKTTYATPKNFDALVKIRNSLATLELACETPTTVKH